MGYVNSKLKHRIDYQFEVKKGAEINSIRLLIYGC